MSNQNSVKSFLDRLEKTALKSQDAGFEILRRRELRYLSQYKRNAVWPGSEYVYLGVCRNLEHRLYGTEKEKNRSRCFALLFEARGDASYCVNLSTAFNFQGFLESLNRFEREMLEQIEPDSLLGPAYDELGRQIPGAFTVWRRQNAKSCQKVLLTV